jgi:hypothetical protein
LENLRKTIKNGFKTNTNKINKNTTKKTTTNKQLTKPNFKHLMTGTALFIAAILVISGTNIKAAFADDVVNDVVVGGGNNVITAGGSTTISYTIVAAFDGTPSDPTNPQGNPTNTCNANDGTSPTLQINVPPGVTATPSSLTYSACNSKQVTFTSDTPGSHQITVTISGDPTDVYVNRAAFTLQVNPAQPTVTKPVMSNVPSNQVLEATSSQGAVATFATPTASDEQGSVSVTCTPQSGSTFPLGVTTVSCSATNSAGTTTNTFTVTVQDTIGPVFSNVPSGVTAEATGPTGAVVAYTTPTATDAVDGDRPVSCEPASGSTFPIDTTPVTCSTSDTKNNPNTATFNVIVQDTTPPTLDLPSGIQAIATSSSGAAVTYTATANDLVAGVVDVNCNPASGETFPLKTTTVLCSATDGTNSEQGSFVVTVTFPQWSGILQPINKDGDSIFKLGSTVPVKFQIPIPGGGYVTDAAAKLLVAKVSSGIVGDEVEATTTTPASSGNVFRYDGTQYIYNLGTKSGYSAGTWQLRIDIGDGSVNSVLISLRK